ncbi:MULTISPECIES: hypothetical protein [Rhizobium/Agrobacterium group]|uniref:hypothetical protein n=1 Tax=Rhizobium/Agrobacterium group TaxID=227290 RepID=UPI0008DC1D28|nr:MULTISPECIES: hypothetical protein [Rhizobium/Agrobacterium group]MCF1434021.1 hypothetical protein [Allorhizobium ampelinum]MCF1481662.1 hypothetical protein [Allorhizobium ampelinum]MUO89961.1 hypothetical protein [Agrobacterium vitis]MUZ51969.1 hypothetical protein [Agrobacterium vitis]MUZ89814.1 hypothetical protein [Agrobacterium vitis]
MKWVAMSVIMLAGPCQAAEQFKVDLSKEEIFKAADVTTLSELAVGEIGFAEGIFCVKDNALYILGNARLQASKSDYTVNYRFKREPGGTFQMNLLFGEKASDKSAKKRVAQLMAFGSDSALCKVAELSGQDMLPISSVNDFKTAGELLRSN